MDKLPDGAMVAPPDLCAALAVLELHRRRLAAADRAVEIERATLPGANGEEPGFLVGSRTFGRLLADRDRARLELEQAAATVTELAIRHRVIPP